MSGQNQEIIILSALSEKSLALASSAKYIPHRNCDTSSCRKNERRIIFSIKNRDSVSSYYLETCKKNHFLLSKRSVVSLVQKYGRKNKMTVILISDDEQDNLLTALQLNSVGWAMSNLNVYAYCSSFESECLFDNINIQNYTNCVHPMKLRRLSPIRNEVYQFFYHNSPFENVQESFGEKWINIVIAGLDQFGTEMLKAILWCCQMEGYFLRVDVFDKNDDAFEVFAMDCPGIVQRGNQPRIGEDYYDLHFHQGIDLHTYRFFKQLNDIPEPSWVFVSAGNDSENIHISQQIRSYYAGRQVEQGIANNHSANAEQSPRIITVVRDDETAKMIAHNVLQNFRGQFYHIDCIGTNSHMYSYENTLMVGLEKEALERHLEYGNEEQFHKFEYFRRSSMASAIHFQYRKALIQEDAELAAIVEHRRWCAYMRSTEGYTYGIIRDDLAKKHPDLTAYDNLSLIAKAKDHALNRSS